MTVLELKGDILEKVSALKDKRVIEDLHLLINAFISKRLEQQDFWEELSPSQRKHLLDAINAAKDKTKWTPHQEAMKKYEKWLS